MDKLFLIEILVEKITFQNDIPNIPPKDIYVVATFGNVVTLEITPDSVTERGFEDTLRAGDIIFSCGKSYLFASDPEALLDAFGLFLLEIKIAVKNDPLPIGTALLPWNSDFKLLAKSASNDDEVSTHPASMQNIYNLTDPATKQIVGSVEVLVRLSCFGNCIQTAFQVQHDRNTRKFLFKNANADTTFQCHRFGAGQSADMLPIGPIAPLYNQTNYNNDDSLRPVFVQSKSPQPSTYNMGHHASDQPIPTVDQTPDMLSLVRRPEEQTFINFGDLQTSKETLKTMIEDKDLTKENIEKLLCKNPNCPAVKKFKEFGIGPLATGKALGTVYQPTDIPLNYGLSHTYGVLENYGPYGVYRRPKTLDQPFVARHENSEASLTSGCCCGAHQQEGSEPLRLTGGSPVGDDRDQFPAPMAACKDIMQDLDDLLKAYKQAIGPCGHGTCPYAGTFIEEACKKQCKMPSQEEENKEEEKKEKMSACGVPTCPYSREPYMPEEKKFKNNQMKAACGSPTCAYAKQKLGFDDDDMNLVSDTCGEPKCKYLYPSMPPLEPIHWDCPEPLPKGRCRNPNCPLLPKDLAAFKIPKPPCESHKCPYAPPPWCGEPSCPFGPPQPCPYGQPNDDECDNDTCPSKNSPQQQNNDPNNPECPFGNTECPFTAQKPSPTEGCGVPGCTYPPFPPPPQDVDEVCSNTECPYATQKSCPPSAAQAPDFIYAPTNEIEVCQNPDCPFQKAKPTSSPQKSYDGYPAPKACNYQPCPFYQRPSDEDCTDPYCPYVQPAPPAPCPYAGGKPPGGPPAANDQMWNPCDSFTCEMKRDRPEACTICKDPSKSSGGSQSAPQIGEQPAAAPLEQASESEKAIGKNGKKKKKKRSKFVYAIGDKYPGVHIGHRECVLPGYKIPPKMGWLWNVFTPCMSLKPRRGWKPGAVGRTIAKRIEEHRQAKGLVMSNELTVRPSRRRIRHEYESESDVTVAPKPTLQIKKKDGVYHITMNPLKDPKTLEDNENPYMECTPLQFKIVKNKDKEKKKAPEDGENCTCNGEGDADEVESVSSSSDSELDIEFTPPAGIIRPERLKRKKNVVHTDTQYNPDDCKPEKIQVGKKGGKDTKDKKGKKDKGEKKAKGGKKKK